MLPQSPNPDHDPLDLKNYTLSDLESLRSEVIFLLNSNLYQIFLLSCDSIKSELVDGALKAKLEGVHDLFTREGILGEANCWLNVKTVFTELQDEITATIKQKTK